MTIALGDSVRATNVDAFGHTFTDNGVWDSGDVPTGRSYTFRFVFPGTYQYVCSYHETRGMTGTITVR
jgi:plastocyanin